MDFNFDVTKYSTYRKDKTYLYENIVDSLGNKVHKVYYMPGISRLFSVDKFKELFIDLSEYRNIKIDSICGGFGQ